MQATQLKTFAFNTFPKLKSYFARRNKETILDEFYVNLRLFESCVNKLNTDRQGLIDYDDLDGKFRYKGFDPNTDPSLRLTIRRLILDKTHTGQFLLCRLIAGSYQLATVNTVIEDPEGGVERLSLHNWTDPEISAAQNLVNRRCIPIGTIMVIRNPYYTTAADGYSVLVVKSAFDVILIENYHPILHGIKWNVKQTSKPRQKKIKKYCLSSEQVLASSNAIAIQQGPHFIRTPKALTPRISKRSSRKPSSNPKSRGINIAFVTATSSEFMEENSTITLICCFIFFLWMFFYTC